VLLHHVALGARDVERVAAFYRDVIGLAEERRHLDDSGKLRSIWLRAEGTLLMIEATNAENERVEGVGAGPFLLAFAIHPDERAEIEARLVGAGAGIESRTPYTSYARDPEGNRVAVSHHPHEGVKSGG
jgi:glyoxylase I family protein